MMKRILPLLPVLTLAASCGGDAGTAPEPVPANQPPNLTSHGGPYEAVEGAALELQAAATDPEGSALTYTWDFGDGESATGASATHAYADDGEYTVTVTARDSQGAEAKASTVARITNVDPVLAPLEVPPVALGESVALQLLVEDPGADTWTAELDWGDGSAPETVAMETREARVTHLYAEPGDYTVALTVRDDDQGQASASVGARVVRPAGPTGTIVFVEGPYLFRMHPDGEGVTQLRPAGEGTQPDWSPDGTRIAFVRADDIYVMGADGAESSLTRLTSSGMNREPAWSPDGTRIAFASTPSGEAPGLFVMNADGSDVKRLTTSSGFIEESPSWSPDGTRIAFGRQASGSDRDLWVVNADGTGAEALLDTQGNSLSPAWSPDGERIVFRHDNALALLQLADGSVRQVLSADHTHMNPTWSPDGEWILVSRLRGGWTDLYRLRPDGTDVTQLTSDSSWEVYPHWTSVTLTDRDGDGVTDDLDRCPSDPGCQ